MNITFIDLIIEMLTKQSLKGNRYYDYGTS